VLFAKHSRSETGGAAEWAGGNGDGITLEQTETHFGALFSSPVKENDHVDMECLRQMCQKVLGFVAGEREREGEGWRWWWTSQAGFMALESETVLMGSICLHL